MTADGALTGRGTAALAVSGAALGAGFVAHLHALVTAGEGTLGAMAFATTFVLGGIALGHRTFRSRPTPRWVGRLATATLLGLATVPTLPVAILAHVAGLGSRAWSGPIAEGLFWGLPAWLFGLIIARESSTRSLPSIALALGGGGGAALSLSAGWAPWLAPTSLAVAASTSFFAQRGRGEASAVDVDRDDASVLLRWLPAFAFSAAAASLVAWLRPSLVEPPDAALSMVLLVGWGLGVSRQRPLVGRAAGWIGLAVALVWPLLLGDGVAVLGRLMAPLHVLLGGAGDVVLVAITALPAAWAAGRLGPATPRSTLALIAAVGWAVGIAGSTSWTPAATLGGAVVCVLAGAAWQALRVATNGNLRTWTAVAGAVLIAGVAWRSGPTAFARQPAREAPALASASDLKTVIREAQQRLRFSRLGRSGWIEVADGDQERVVRIAGRNVAHTLTGTSAAVLAPLIAAARHAGPERALILGLEGSHAAASLLTVPGLRALDVVEPEADLVPASVLAFGHDPLLDGRARWIRRPGRAFLAGNDQYDIALVNAEPAVGHREVLGSRVAGPLDRRFFAALAKRMRSGGVVAVQLPTPRLDASRLRALVTAARPSFPRAELWWPGATHLLLVLNAPSPSSTTLDRLGVCADSAPWATATARWWGVDGLAGFLSGWLASEDLAADLELLDLGGAFDGLDPGGHDLPRILAAALRSRTARASAGRVETAAIEAAQRARNFVWDTPVSGSADPWQGARVAYRDGDLRSALLLRPEGPPPTPWDRLLAAESAADFGDARAFDATRTLDPVYGPEVAAIEARLFWRQGDAERAAERLVDLFGGLRRGAIASPAVVDRALPLATSVAAGRPTLADRLEDSVAAPFAGGQAERRRQIVRISLARIVGDPERCAAAVVEGALATVGQERTTLRSPCDPAPSQDSRR